MHDSSPGSGDVLVLIRKQRDDALDENFTLRNDNIRLRDLVVEGEARLEDAIVKHNKTVLSFAETIQCIVHTSSYDTNKRLRTDDGVGNDGRVEGVDLYIDSLMEHKKEECEKMIESLKSAHKKEILRLQAKVDRPVNEFRINKQFHIREDELKREIGRLKYRLDEARKQAAASEWDEREKMFLKKDIGEMKKRCSDRDQLLARIEELESQVRRFEDMLLEGNTRGETDEQLLERIEALTEERNVIIVSAAKELDIKTKMLADAVKTRDEKVIEVEKLRVCVQGRLNSCSTSAGLCKQCTTTHDFIIESLVQKQTTELNRLHCEIVRLKEVLDGQIDAKEFAGRYLEREKELRKESEKYRKMYQTTLEQLSQTKYLVKNKHDMTEKCKRQVKTMELKFADYDELKTRVVELEKSVMQDSVVSDLAKKHSAQMQRAKRAHNLSRSNAMRLALELNAEQLRMREDAAFEDDLIFAYRSLRAEYNRDVGRAPSIRRPRRDGWLDDLSEGEPDVE